MIFTSVDFASIFASSNKNKNKCFSNIKIEDNKKRKKNEQGAHKKKLKKYIKTHMKNLLSIAAVIVSGIFFANTASAQQANVTVNLHFNDFSTITVNGANNSTVDLYFQTLEDYQNGVETVKQNQLSVASTKGYEIQVKSTSVNFSGSENGAIDLEDVSVALARNNTSNFSAATNLSQTATTVYDSTENTIHGGGTPHSFDVKYMAKDGNLTNKGALKQEYLGKTLSADIVYTLLAK